MNRADRWDLYMMEHSDRETNNIAHVSHLAEEFAAILQTQNAEKLLDLGCGFGRHSIFLARKGFQVIGCDISEEALLQAEHYSRKNGLKINFTQADYLDLPFNNDIFDGVMAIDILHHDFMENIAKAIKEIHRVLAPGGLLCLNPLCVNDALFGAGRQLGNKLFLIHRIPHFFFYPEELKTFLERMNFKIIHLSTQKYQQERDGEIINREKIRCIAQKIEKKRIYWSPTHSPLF